MKAYFIFTGIFLSLFSCVSYEVGQIKFPEEFPKEIDGCSCYYASYHYKLELGEMLWVDNLDSTGFCRINDSIHTFQLISKNDSLGRWENETFTAEISTYFTERHDFVYRIRGELNIQTRQGKTIYKESVVGECGC